MDIERIKKISEAKINAGNVVNKVRKTLKEYNKERQDVQEELSQVYKPIVKAQQDIKQTIDEKQDKMLEQLQKNQESLTDGLQNVLMIQHMPEMIQEQQPLAIGYDIFDSGEELDSEKKKKKPIIKTDMNIGFDKDDLATLATHQ